jgi:hypothetical protein
MPNDNRRSRPFGTIAWAEDTTRSQQEYFWALAVNAFVAVTGRDWFTHLEMAGDLDEVNFWQPTAAGAFQAIDSGGLFLFKLHARTTLS